jgi:hypothetical protein
VTASGVPQHAQPAAPTGLPRLHPSTASVIPPCHSCPAHHHQTCPVPRAPASPAGTTTASANTVRSTHRCRKTCIWDARARSAATQLLEGSGRPPHRRHMHRHHPVLHKEPPVHSHRCTVCATVCICGNTRRAFTSSAALAESLDPVFPRPHRCLQDLQHLGA